MEQISASIANFVLSAVDEKVTPYYNDLKEGFRVPAVFFPEFEVGNTPESLDAYAFNYAWYIKFFHSTTERAYILAKNVLNRLVGGRYLVPIVDENGDNTGKTIRVKRAETKKVDSGVYQMWIDWDECYEYDDLANKPEKMQTYDILSSLKEEEM